MATKTKKVSITAMDKAISENIAKVTTIEWCGLEIEVTRMIPFNEAVVLIENAAAACFANEDSSYMPYVLWPALRAGIIEAYTNITMPSNPEKIYAFAYADGLYDKILANVNGAQIDDIISATIEMVKAAVDSKTSAISKEMSDIHSYLENLDSGLSDVLSGVGSEDLKKLISAVNNGALDEDKVVKAYLDTYKE